MAAVVAATDGLGTQITLLGETFHGLGEGDYGMERHTEFHGHAVADAALHPTAVVGDSYHPLLLP